MSRQLDAEVAEKIFGWTKHHNGRSTSVEEAKIEWEYHWVPKEFNGDTDYWRVLPHYSSYWKDAGKLMEHMRKITGVEKLSLEATFGDSQWCASIGKMFRCADSAPEAICLVSLDWITKNPHMKMLADV